MVRSPTYQPHTRSNLDPIRIVAISASIMANAILLAFLFRPMEYTPLPADAASVPAQFIDKLPIQKPKDPLPIVKPHPQTNPAHPQPIDHQPIAQLIPHQQSAMDVPVDTKDVIDTIGPITPLKSLQTIEASLTPIASPAPIYPRDALRDGITGTVELELLVGVDGNVLSVRITHSSGNRQLDNAARDQVLRNWRFQPAMRDGVAVQALGRVPIAFTVDGR